MIKILILEDSKSDVDLLLYELKKNDFLFSYEVVQTQSTYEKALNDFIPDIILSDFSLPSFDAVSAFHIKQEICSDTPFIIVSGIIGEENAVDLIKSGVTDYILKDKLFSIGPKISRALKEAKELKEKKLADEQLKIQLEKLKQIAFLQSHQVRGPIARVLGLINLFNFDNPSDPLNTEVIIKLHKTTKDFDEIIREIVQKTSEIEIM